MTQLIPASLPPDVAYLVANNDLGQHRSTYAPSKRWRLIVPLIILAVMGLILTAAGLVNGQAGGIGAGLVWDAITFGLLTWALASSPLVSAAARQRQFYVFDRGFVRVTRKGPVAYRWDGVRALYQAITQTRYNGISTGTNYSYKLEMADGRVAKLTTMATDMAKFGPLIATEVARAQFPPAWHAITVGQPLTFGPFTITGGGISAGGKAGLPWSQVKAVQLSQGRVRVEQASKMLSYATAMAAKVPNLYLFMELTGRLTGPR